MTKQEKDEIIKFTVHASKTIGKPVLIVGDKGAYILDHFENLEPMERLGLVATIADRFKTMRDDMMMIVLQALVDGSEENEDEPSGAIH